MAVFDKSIPRLEARGEDEPVLDWDLGVSLTLTQENFLLIKFPLINYLLINFLLINFLLINFILVNFLLINFLLINFLLINFILINFLLVNFLLINILLINFLPTWLWLTPGSLAGRPCNRTTYLTQGSQVSMVIF